MFQCVCFSVYTGFACQGNTCMYFSLSVKVVLPPFSLLHDIPGDFPRPVVYYYYYYYYYYYSFTTYHVTFPGPLFALTVALTISSSAVVQGPLIRPGRRTICHR